MNAICLNRFGNNDIIIYYKRNIIGFADIFNGNDFFQRMRRHRFISILNHCRASFKRDRYLLNGCYRRRIIISDEIKKKRIF